MGAILPLVFFAASFRKKEVPLDFYINEDTALLRRIARWAVDVVVTIALASLLICGQVRISGNSMQPLLEASDVVLVNRLAYDLGKPKRYDVVVFGSEDRKNNVKRVIGLPGETVQIIGGLVYIDGAPLEDESGLGQVSLAGRAGSPITLGEDEYFLLGDNRDSSEDSRFANVGNVKADQIQGKVWLRILPILKLGFL